MFYNFTFSTLPSAVQAGANNSMESYVNHISTHPSHYHRIAAAETAGGEPLQARHRLSKAKVTSWPA